MAFLCFLQKVPFYNNSNNFLWARSFNLSFCCTVLISLESQLIYQSTTTISNIKLIFKFMKMTHSIEVINEKKSQIKMYSIHLNTEAVKGRVQIIRYREEAGQKRAANFSKKLIILIEKYLRFFFLLKTKPLAYIFFKGWLSLGGCCLPLQQECLTWFHSGSFSTL